MYSEEMVGVIDFMMTDASDYCIGVGGICGTCVRNLYHISPNLGALLVLHLHVDAEVTGQRRARGE